MAEGVHSYGNILLGSRGGASAGQLRLSASGMAWKKAGGGRSVEIPRKDIESMTWMKVSKGCQLAVQKKDGGVVNFLGFRDQDFSGLQQLSSTEYGTEIKEEGLAVSGHNWGKAVIDGSSLVFKIGSKQAFRVALSDVGQVQHAKDEVMLDFPIDDTADNKEDALMELTFHIPRDNEMYAGDEETPAAKVFADNVLEHSNAGVALGDVTASFDNVAVLNPRGRFEVEMYLNFLKLVGQTQDFRIQFENIVRLFLLPKSHTPQTLVAISLDPPIRKGQTYYTHVLCQFNNDEQITIDLDITDEALAAKNAKCGGKLKKVMEGDGADVFARTLRGLSGAKLTRPGAFKTADDCAAVRCSFKSDDGYLYPLERAFFYVQKPPTLLPHDEIDSVEFLRQGGGVLAASAKTFDLNIRMKHDQEFLFRNITKSEWTNLFAFIRAKSLRVENLKEAEMGPGGPGRALDLGNDMDAGKAQMHAMGDMDEESEEDEDFDAGSDQGEDDEEGDEDSDAEEAPRKKEKKEKKEKRPAAERPASAPKPKKAKAEKPEKADDGKKKRKKKDKNAPKGALSAFMYFSNAIRETVKTENPGIAFGEVGKVIGEKWKAIDPEEKTKYEALAAKDKERYQGEMVTYKETLAAAAADGGGDESD